MRYLDLTYTLTEGIPVWPGGTRLGRQIHKDYSESGFRVISINQAVGIGTHVDAPSHFVEGGRDIPDLLLDELINEACVIDVRDQVSKNPDYEITKSDIESWEAAHGLVPESSIFLGCTGWSQYWGDEARYLNVGADGKKHFPGFSEEAARYLVDRGISGVGIDAISIDCGIAEDFPAHKVFLGNDKYQIENLMGLEQLPPRGATLYVMPHKIGNGPEAPARVVASVEP